MQRARLAPTLALVTLGCGGGDPQDATSFPSPDGTSGGPSSFSDSATSTGVPTTGDITASTSTSTMTDDPTTTSTTTTDASTTTGTTAPAPSCGDGTVDDGEQCDDGNPDDGDACLGDCTAGHSLLVIVGRGDEPAAIATYTPGADWTVTAATYDISAAELEPTTTGALAILRRAGAVPTEQDELWFAEWTAQDPESLNSAEVVGAFGFTLDAPAIASVADTVTLAFLGTDNKHYTSIFTAGAWTPFAPLPASMIQIQAFGPSAATLVAGSQDTLAVYAGDDDRVYIARKPQPDAAWDASVQAPPPAVIDTIRPAAVVLAGGDLVLAYVRKSDSQIGLTRRSVDDNTWSLEALVDPSALASAITLLRTDADTLVLAWRDNNDPGIHLATGAAHDAWDPPITVEVPASSSVPVLTPGTLGADAELLYAAGGKLRHARILAGAADPPVDVADITAATTVAAARVQRAP